MAENQAAGPLVGQSVVYTPSAGVTYAAIVTAVDRTTGLARLNVFPPGGTITDAQNVQYDYTRNVVFPSWSFHSSLSGI